MKQLYENNVYIKQLAPILLIIILRVIFVSLGLHLEALTKLRMYFRFWNKPIKELLSSYNTRTLRYAQKLFDKMENGLINA